MAAALFEIQRKQTEDLVDREVLEGQQILLHADWIANDQTVAGWNRSNATVIRNPVRTTEHLSAIEHQVAIVCQRETGKTKAAAGAEAVRPSRQYFLQVMIHERMLEHVTGTIGNKCTIGDGVFAAGVFGISVFADIEHTLSFLCAEQLE